MRRCSAIWVLQPGPNLAHYPPGIRLTGVDLGPAMLACARACAAALGLTVDLVAAAAGPSRHRRNVPGPTPGGQVILIDLVAAINQVLLRSNACGKGHRAVRRRLPDPPSASARP